MFQFPGFALKTLCIHVLSTCLCLLLIAKLTIINIQVGSPIQKSMDQSLFSAPHGLSQSITSFIASYCQGIHQTPFSRLIWSRKSQMWLPPSASPTLVHMAPLFRSKVILSRLDTCQCIQTMSNFSVARVSVLDLDNSVRFKLGYIQMVEEKTNSKCLPNKCKEPEWDQPHT